MNATKERILQMIEARRALSAPEIGASLGLTRAACRYHLQALAAEGLIEPVAPEPNTARRGRPRQTYRRVPEDAPAALAALCAVLIDLLPEDEVTAARIAQGLAGGLTLTGAPTTRLNRAVARVNALGGQARWLATPGGPRISIRRCPFARLAQIHPLICRVEHMLLEQLVGQRLRQVASHCAGQLECVFAWTTAEP